MSTIRALILFTLTAFNYLSLTSQSLRLQLEFDSSGNLVEVLDADDPYVVATRVVHELNDSFRTEYPILNIDSAKFLISQQGLVISFPLEMYQQFDYSSWPFLTLSTEFKELANYTSRIRGWINKNLRANKKWRSKRVAEFLNTSNEEIAAELISQEKAISDNLLNRVLWHEKIAVFISSMDLTKEFINSIDDDIKRDTAFWTQSILLPVMRLANYKLLLKNASDPQVLVDRAELNAKKHPENLYYKFNYAALLYAIGVNMPLATGLSDSVQVNGFKIDYKLLSDQSIYELKFVEKIFNERARYLNVDATVLDIDMSPISISKFIDKELVVVSFWGTWCKPCIESMPELEKLANFNRGKFQFITIANDRPASWLRYVRKYGSTELQFTLIMDSIEHVCPGLGRVYPTYLITDSNGNVVYGPTHTIDNLETGIRIVTQR